MLSVVLRVLICLVPYRSATLMLSDECSYTEFHYAECQYVEFSYAMLSARVLSFL